MGVKLRVLGGSSPETLTLLSVNQDVSQPLKIENEEFSGYLTIRLADIDGNDVEGSKSEPESGYFTQKCREGKTLSIQVQGRFLKDYNTDEIVWGNVFDKPIRDSLPYGTSAVVKFIQHRVDGALEQDLYADKPWAWSALFSSVNFISVKKSAAGENADQWNPEPPSEDCLSLFERCNDREEVGNEPSLRRKWFANKANRTGVVVGKDHLITTDFCNGYINFSTLALKIPAIHLEIPLVKHWDGQPVRYECRTRTTGVTFWCVLIEIVDEEILKKKNLPLAESLE